MSSEQCQQPSHLRNLGLAADLSMAPRSQKTGPTTIEPLTQASREVATATMLMTGTTASCKSRDFGLSLLFFSLFYTL